jgi:hypothetical protein
MTAMFGIFLAAVAVRPLGTDGSAMKANGLIGLWAGILGALLVKVALEGRPLAKQGTYRFEIRALIFGAVAGLVSAAVSALVLDGPVVPFAAPAVWIYVTLLSAEVGTWWLWLKRASE